MNHKIRAIFRDYGRLTIDVDTLSDTSDLYEAGLTSHASVDVMLALENEFDVEFEDRMLSRGVFSTLANTQEAINELLGRREAISKGA